MQIALNKKWTDQNRLNRSLRVLMSTFLSLGFVMLAGLISSCQMQQAETDVRSSSVESVHDVTPVILISIDGFRWDYIEKFGAKNLAEMGKSGVRADYMRPVYPSKTFPNHLTLATGLYPTRHGIIDNRFYDKRRLSFYERGDGQKDSSWISGTPIWNLVRMQGLKSATYFWPESDALIGGMTPNYYFHYSKWTSNRQRLEQIIDWLNLPASSRPHFITGYFSMVDSAGHHHGPDSDETREAVLEADALIGELRQRMKTEVNRPVNLIVLSDHGMATIDPDQAIVYESLNIDEGFKVVNSGTRLMLYADGTTSQTRIQQQRQKLNSDDRFQLLTQDDLEALHYTLHSGIADIILETQAPRLFVSRTSLYSMSGQHGYRFDPESRDMAAIFLAEGPAFKPGTRLPPFGIQDVYPAIARILGLTPPTDIDGQLSSIAPALSQSL